MDDDGECGYSEMEGELCGKTALTQNFEDQDEDEEGSLELITLESEVPTKAVGGRTPNAARDSTSI